MPDVLNLQQKVKIELPLYRKFVKEVVSVIPETFERSFSVAFIADNRMKQLNEMFRDKDSTTDVLSFPHEPDEFDPDKNNLGDIVISVERAKKRLRENFLTPERETKRLTLNVCCNLS